MKKQNKKLIAGAMGGVLLLGGIMSNIGMVYADGICELHRPSGLCLPIKNNKGNQQKWEEAKLEKEKALENIPRVRHIIKDGNKREKLLNKIDKDIKKEGKSYFYRQYKDINAFKEALMKKGEIIADGEYVIGIGNHLFFLHIDK